MIEPRLHPGPLLTAALLLGVGLGGFVDGILLHQIFQWHNMVSGVVAPVDLVTAKVNMFWDGLFHAFTWLVTALGLALLWRASLRDDVAWSGRLLVGGLLMGWALFNLVEGTIDHQLLGLHHVREGASAAAYDWAFLGVSAALLLVGWAVARGAARRPVRPRRAVAPYRERPA